MSSVVVLKESPLGERLRKLYEGATHDSPLMLTPWEHDFIREMHKKMTDNIRWWPSKGQQEKINEVWEKSFDE